MGEVLDALQWGTVGEWVGGLATAAGLVFAGWQIRRDALTRRAAENRRIEEEEARREAMARSVSVRADLTPTGREQGRFLYQLDCRAHNGGDFPIDDVVVVIADPAAPIRDLANQQGAVREIVFGTVAAGETQSDKQNLTFDAQPVFAELTSLAGVLFTDAWGNHWYRAGGTLRRRELPPRIC